jgi:hypothetical protein
VLLFIEKTTIVAQLSVETEDHIFEEPERRESKVASEYHSTVHRISELSLKAINLIHSMTGFTLRTTEAEEYDAMLCLLLKIVIAVVKLPRENCVRELTLYVKDIIACLAYPFSAEMLSNVVKQLSRERIESSSLIEAKASSVEGQSENRIRISDIRLRYRSITLSRSVPVRILAAELVRTLADDVAMARQVTNAFSFPNDIVQ